MSREEIILGIDPGLVNTGWGLIKSGFNPQYIDHGCIKTESGWQMGKRLDFLYKNILKVIDDYEIDSVAIEKFFVGVNAATTIKTVHARGVLLLAFHDFKVKEYSPNSVKKSVVGEGFATKGQMEFMIRQVLFGGDNEVKLNEHEADALGVALCHASVVDLDLLSGE